MTHLKRFLYNINYNKIKVKKIKFKKLKSSQCDDKKYI